jgi:hypothetical protein
MTWAVSSAWPCPRRASARSCSVSSCPRVSSLITASCSSADTELPLLTERRDCCMVTEAGRVLTIKLRSLVEKALVFRWYGSQCKLSPPSFGGEDERGIKWRRRRDGRCLYIYPCPAAGRRVVAAAQLRASWKWFGGARGDTFHGSRGLVDTAKTVHKVVFLTFQNSA